jgi:CRP-like cAMP-binding protein
MDTAIRTVAVPTTSARPSSAGRSSPAHPLRDIDGFADVMHYKPGEQICIEGRNSDCWGRIISGAAWRLAPLAGRQRQELDLLRIGDYFGFCVPDARGFTIEAAGDGATIMRYPGWLVEFLAEVEPMTVVALHGLARQAVYRMRSKLL